MLVFFAPVNTEFSCVRRKIRYLLEQKKQAYCDKNKEIILDDDIDEKFTNLKNDLITIIKAGIAQSFDDDAFTHHLK